MTDDIARLLRVLETTDSSAEWLSAATALWGDGPFVIPRRLVKMATPPSREALDEEARKWLEEIDDVLVAQDCLTLDD